MTPPQNGESSPPELLPTQQAIRAHLSGTFSSLCSVSSPLVGSSVKDPQVLPITNPPAILVRICKPCLRAQPRRQYTTPPSCNCQPVDCERYSFPCYFAGIFPPRAFPTFFTFPRRSCLKTLPPSLNTPPKSPKVRPSQLFTLLFSKFLRCIPQAQQCQTRLSLHFFLSSPIQPTA